MSARVGGGRVSRQPAGPKPAAPKPAAPRVLKPAVPRSRAPKQIVQTIAETAKVTAAAAQMAEQQIGCLVVLDKKGAPVGLVTDRDLALRVVADGRAPERTLVKTVMSTPLVTARADEALDAVLLRMESRGVRRMPILERGKVVRVVALDDLLFDLGREIDDLGVAVMSEFTYAQRKAKIQQWQMLLRQRVTEASQLIDRVTGTARKKLEEWLGRVKAALNDPS